MSAMLEGFRIEITPRRVRQIMMERGYKENQYSTETIEDIIVNRSENNLLALYSKDGRKSFTLEFCFKDYGSFVEYTPLQEK